MHRFYAPALSHEGALTTLPDDEARHLTQVLRLALGDDVRVFDGRGREHLARVEIAARGRAELRIGAAVATAPEPRVAVTLAAALLKGDKYDEVVRDATMLGVGVIQPMVTARTEVPAVWMAHRARAARWHRVALSSTKQCGRAVLPDVRDPLPFSAVLAASPAPLLMLAEPSAALAESRLPSRPAAATLLVGPEGGWSADEIAAAREARALFIRFGTRTLRADAVPIVALAIALYEWDAL